MIWLPRWLRCAHETSVASTASGGSGAGDGAQRQEGRVLKQIARGQRTMRRLRLATGSLLMVMAVLLSVVYELCLRAQNERFREYHGCGSDFLDHIVSLATNFTLVFRLICLCLVPVAGDIRMTRVILFLDFAVVNLVIVQGLVWKGTEPELAPHSTFGRACAMTMNLVCIVFGCLTLRAICIADGMRMQTFMWKSLALCIALMMPPKIAQCVMLSFFCHHMSPLCWTIPLYIPCFLIAMSPSLRESLHARLYHIIEKRSAYKGAAGIAELVGDCPAKEVMALATQRFRAIMLSDLTFEDIVDNKPNAKLNALAFPVRLDECDCFISHSWHDDPTAKWQALQGWRADFLAEHGREPRIWFDKCCIDQNNIDADLRCLPVFLSGCKKLVVLCGHTYLSRLWCVVELFTYVHLWGSPQGRSVSDIEFLRVGGRGSKLGLEDLESQPSMRDGFTSFDARGCECFHAQDKERMLCVIKAAFGSLEAFNQCIRDTFADADWRLSPRSRNPAQAMMVKDLVTGPAESEKSAGKTSGEVASAIGGGGGCDGAGCPDSKQAGSER